jgi:hypothetical protein
MSMMLGVIGSFTTGDLLIDLHLFTFSVNWIMHLRNRETAADNKRAT